MKKIIMSICLAFLSFNSFASYKIHACRISFSRLAELDWPIGVFHVYIKRITPQSITSLHFEPEHKDYAALILDQHRDATISKDNFDTYPAANCIEVFSTTEESPCNEKWLAIEQHFDNAAENYRYHLYGRDGANCGLVTEQALKHVGLSYPFTANTNGQESFERMRATYGKEPTPENLWNAAATTVVESFKIATEIAKPACTIQ